MQHDPTRWKADYDRDGYLVVEDCINADMLAKLRAAVEKITNDPDSLPNSLKSHVQFERDYVKQQPQYNEMTADQVGNAVRNIMELPRFDPLFSDFILHEPLLDVLEALFASSEFHFHNYKCIIKAPRVSSQFRWHRDLPYLEHSTPNLITAMVCLDDMTVENGATVVMPGSHRWVGDKSNPADMDILEDQLPEGERVTVICPAGSVVLFHVNIIHGGGANRSDNPRRNVIGIWAGPDTYPIKGYRYHYQGLYPRSADPARQKQTRLAFPHLVKEGAAR